MVTSVNSKRSKSLFTIEDLPWPLEPSTSIISMCNWHSLVCAVVDKIRSHAELHTLIKLFSCWMNHWFDSKYSVAWFQSVVFWLGTAWLRFGSSHLSCLPSHGLSSVFLQTRPGSFSLIIALHIVPRWRTGEYVWILCFYYIRLICVCCVCLDTGRPSQWPEPSWMLFRRWQTWQLVPEVCEKQTHQQWHWQSIRLYFHLWVEMKTSEKSERFALFVCLDACSIM